MRTCLRQAVLAAKGAARTAIILLALVAAALIGGRALMADEPPPGVTPLYPAPNDRLGFGATNKGAVTDYDVATLGAGWYYNWGAQVNPPHPDHLGYAYMLRVPIANALGVRTVVAQVTASDPGALWLIGNEPDVATMDNVLPEVYAESYYRAYHLIKAHDPTAVVAPGGIVMPTALRLCYLNKILYAYEARYGQPLPADAWHIHNYVLNEQRGQLPGAPPGFCTPYGMLPGLSGHDDMDQFGAQVRAMRGWMRDYGYREMPLVISEYGILYPQQHGFDYYRVRDFMFASFDYLLRAADPVLGYPPDDGHLVQTWNWFSLDDNNFSGSGLTWGALFDPVFKQRLPMGDAWASYVTDNHLRVLYADVVPAAIRLAADDQPYYGEASPVTVRVMAVNRGNAPVEEPFEVAIYAGEPGQGGMLLGSQEVSGLPARYEGGAWAEAAWTVPATAAWTLTAQISDTQRSLALGRRIDVHMDTLRVKPANFVLVPPGETTTLTITATVLNYGNMGLRDVELTLWEGGLPGSGRLLKSTTLSRLPPLAPAEIGFLWTEVPAGRYEIYGVASLPAAVPEDDLTNNQVRQQIVVASHQLNLPLVPAVSGCVTQEERNLIHNGSFETGDLTSWQIVGRPIVRADASHTVDGSYYAWLGMRDNAHDAVHQTVTLPRRAACVVLLYAWGIYTRDTCDAGSPKDRLTVSLRDVTGQTLQVLETISECDVTEYWQGRAVDLHAYAGQTIQVHFQVDTDASAPSYVALDDIHVQVWAGE